MLNAKSGSSSITAVDLVGERTRIIARLRWHVHELDPGWTQPARMDRVSAFVKVEAHVSDFAGLVADLAARLVDHLRRLTVEIVELAAEITSRTTVLAPSLLAIPGCGALTAATIIGERRAGRPIPLEGCVSSATTPAAPLPVWSSNHARHRLSRTGNRQINAGIHRIALTQARCHAPARELLDRRRKNGDGGMEALRVLKRRLSDVVFRAMVVDQSLTIIDAAA